MNLAKSHNHDIPPAPEAGLAEMYKVGIGPSSSHTMGPMKAAGLFLQRLNDKISGVHRLTATLYGSLAWTGRGHATDKAVILGFAGETPDGIDPDRADQVFQAIAARKKLKLKDDHSITFDPATDVVFDTKTPAKQHSNTMRFEAFDASGGSLSNEIWYSIGGGFVLREGETGTARAENKFPYPFRTGDEMLAMGRESGKSLAEMALANEDTRRPRAETLALVKKYSDTMLACIARGLTHDGILPGGLKVKRRAKGIFDQLESDKMKNIPAPNRPMDYVSVFAIAVNEENAAGGRVVTAPTNGAAGVVPAVLRYFLDFCATGQSEAARDNGVQAYFLASAAIGSIIKRNSSISGAEMGCQGEVGSAAAMAAAGLAAALGATNAQIENAAEIAIEHHLGMTCDPIGGLVQIPCIERNAFGAVKAINAASLAMHGDGTHRVSLDQAVETMRQTGNDMKTKYKETSKGGLAVNAIEC